MAPKRPAPAPAPAKITSQTSESEEETSSEEQTPKLKATSSSKKLTSNKSKSSSEEESMKTASEIKKPFQRVWNEHDDIALLQGMIDFFSEQGADPCTDMAVFHIFIKKLLDFEVSKRQLSDKIRRLKKKFKNNSARGKNGKNPKFSNLHEEKAFELSKKVWGGGGVSEKIVTDSSKVQLSPPSALSSGLSLCVTTLTRLQVGLDEQVVRRGMEQIEPAKRAKLEETWMVLAKNEMELAGKKAEIAMQTAREILEAYDASSNK